jgi:hypothetical protein
MIDELLEHMPKGLLLLPPSAERIVELHQGEALIELSLG